MIKLAKELLILALLSVVLLGCHGEVKEAVVEGPAPIPKIIYFDSRVVVYPTVPWEQLVHAEIFEGFRPGMTFIEAEEEVGEPDRIVQGISGRSYEYRRKEGVVLLSLEEVRSGLSDAVYSSWKLRAVPRNREVGDVLMPLLEQRLELTAQERTELVIMSPQGDRPTLEVILESGQVESITWLPDSGR